MQAEAVSSSTSAADDASGDSCSILLPFFSCSTAASHAYGLILGTVELNLASMRTCTRSLCSSFQLC